MSKLISCAAVGAFLLTVAIQVPASAQLRGGRAGVAAPAARGGAIAVPTFRGNPGVVTPGVGAGAPVFRGSPNTFAYQGRDRDRGRFRGRRFFGGGDVYAYDYYPDYYYDDSGCSYVWAWRDGVRR